MRHKLSIIIAGAIILTSFAVVVMTLSEIDPPSRLSAQLMPPSEIPLPPGYETNSVATPTPPATPDTPPPYEPNEVIVVFQDDQGGIGQQVEGNTYQSNETVESQIENRLQAIIPDEDLEIDSRVLFNANLVDPSTRREAQGRSHARTGDQPRQCPR